MNAATVGHKARYVPAPSHKGEAVSVGFRCSCRVRAVFHVYYATGPGVTRIGKGEVWKARSGDVPARACPGLVALVRVLDGSLDAKEADLVARWGFEGRP